MIAMSRTKDMTRLTAMMMMVVVLDKLDDVSLATVDEFNSPNSICIVEVPFKDDICVITVAMKR